MQTEHRDHTHGKQSHEKRSLMFRVCPNLTSVQSKKESACKATLMLSAKKALWGANNYNLFILKWRRCMSTVFTTQRFKTLSTVVTFKVHISKHAASRHATTSLATSHRVSSTKRHNTTPLQSQRIMMVPQLVQEVKRALVLTCESNFDHKRKERRWR